MTTVTTHEADEAAGRSLERTSGILMVAAIVIGLVAINSPLQWLYSAIHHVPIHIGIGGFGFTKPMVSWINEGLMALFFLAVSLEIKKEFMEGLLASRRALSLPAIAAVGGMVVPVSVYLAFNWNDAVAARGWAVPMATDIVLVLGALSVLGHRVPASIKVFLTAVAIFDDVGAIAIIAVFYGGSLSIAPLAVAALSVAALAALSRRRVLYMLPYAAVGAVLWAALLEAGIEASLAGVLVGAAFPCHRDDGSVLCSIDKLERRLKPWSALFVVPLFALFNAGVSVDGITSAALSDPVTLGIFLGLFVGKQLGVFSAVWVAVKLGFADMPSGANWSQIYGAGLLAGVGFTMSLFIGSLAFPDAGVMASARLAILAASAVSALAGLAVLYRSAAHADGARHGAPAAR